MQLDKITRERALKLNPNEDVTGNLNVDILDVHNGNIKFDNKAIRFEVTDRGHADLKGSDLERVLETSEDERLLGNMNGRWMASIKRDDTFYLFNCHPTETDGTSKLFSKCPAAIFCVQSAADAAEVLKRFGMAIVNPNGIFAVHAVTIESNE